MLTQSEDAYFEQAPSVLLHPWQLRSICEHFHVLPVSTPLAERRLQTMARRLNGLKDRINDLCEYMANHSDHRNADLSYEMVTVNALADLATEWCEELDVSADWVAVENPLGSEGGAQLHTAGLATPAESAPRSSCAPQQPVLL